MSRTQPLKQWINQIAPEHSRRRAVLKRARVLVGGLSATPSKDEGFNAIHKKLLASAPEDLVIFDIGAHAGESVKRFKALFPKARIFAFEPDPQNFAKLKNNTAGLSNVSVFNYGLGARTETLEFFRNAKSNTSSLNAVNTNSDWARGRAQRRGLSVEEFTQDIIRVEIRALDSVRAELGLPVIHLMKIDTQGHEDEVLKGAQDSLASGAIHVIETELILGNPYQKSLNFSSLENLLLGHDYKFVALNHGGNLINTPDLNVDLIYAKRGILTP